MAHEYPLEYVLRHHPLMIVSGLTETVQSPSMSPSRADDAPAVRQKLGSIFTGRNANSTWDTRHASPHQQQLIKIGNGASSQTNAGMPPGTSLFHTVLVDKSYSIPTRGVTGSPLSPQTPGSLLNPDGIMHPAWVRKHREQAPSVMVTFYEFFESTSSATSDPLQANSGPVVLEREKDQVVVNDILAWKKQCQDAGIDFAAVVMLRLHLPSDPSVEERLAYIRRSCSLGPKGLFVLAPLPGIPGTSATPSSPWLVDAGDFITLYVWHVSRLTPRSLQKSLLESSFNYYKNQIKRVRRKRARFAPPGPPPATQGLGPLGWIVRYEYKTAVFSEFRQELPVAIKAYEACYQVLWEMFVNGMGVASKDFIAQGNAVSPWSGRWHEAKLLADTVNLKICKLYFYCDQPHQALQQFHTHISRFSQLPEYTSGKFSKMPSIYPKIPKIEGGGNFEYWAWCCRQFRVMGELVEMASVRLGLALPQVPTATNDPFPSHNPVQMLQHAGFWYLLAARCAEQRWNAFEAQSDVKQSEPSLQKYSSMPTVTIKTSETPSTGSPVDYSKAARATEQSVDHSAQNIELLTKAYEQFKRYKSGRFTFFLASEIAKCYERAGKSDMALKFFERIAKSYRKENWTSILVSVLEQSLASSTQPSQSCKVLLELMSGNVTKDEEKRRDYTNQLLKLMKEQMDPLDVVLDVPTVFSANVVAKPGLESSTMQIVLSCNLPPSIQLVPDAIRAIDAVKHSSSNHSASWRIIEGKQDDLTLSEETHLLFSGPSGEIPANVDLQFGQVHLIVPLQKPDSPQWITLEDGKPTFHPITSMEQVGLGGALSRKINVSVQQSPPSLVDEHYPFQVVVKNGESHDISAMVVCSLIQPEGASFYGTTEKTFFEGPFTVTASSSHSTQVILCSTIPGERQVRVQVVCKKSNGESIPSANDVPSLLKSFTGHSTQEHVETVKIPVHPFLDIKCTAYAIQPQQKTMIGYPGESLGIRRFMITVTARTMGGKDLQVESCRLDPKSPIELLDSALIKGQVWKPGKLTNVCFLVQIAANQIAQKSQLLGHLNLDWKISEQLPLSSSRIPLAINFPTGNGVKASLIKPSSVKAAEPFTFGLNVENVSSSTCRLEVTVEPSEGMVFGGLKQVTIHLLPHSVESLVFNGYPTASGLVQLPKVKIVKKKKPVGEEIPTEEVIAVEEQGSIFVEP